MIALAGEERKEEVRRENNVENEIRKESQLSEHIPEVCPRPMTQGPEVSSGTLTDR